MALAVAYQDTIDQVSQRLKNTLLENLYSCVLYGSTVRGNVVTEASDINLLLILNRSTADAHIAISNCIKAKIKVSPFRGAYAVADFA